MKLSLVEIDELVGLAVVMLSFYSNKLKYVFSHHSLMHKMYRVFYFV